MNTRYQFGAVALMYFLLIGGCATTKITDREEINRGQLPRPTQIWVYDFAATSSDVPDESALNGLTGEHSTPQTPQQIATGRRVGSEIALELVSRINAMGLAAEHAGPSTKPELHDLVIRGYILAIVKGDETERVAIGLGEGDSELKAAVEAFEVTANGLEKLGGGDTDATGNKTPGVGIGLISMLATHNPLGLIVSSGMKYHDEKTGEATISGRAKQTADDIADQMKTRFQQEGWIN